MLVQLDEVLCLSEYVIYSQSSAAGTLASGVCRGTLHDTVQQQCVAIY